MNIYDIEAFLMAVRLGNFSSAAQMLSVTQPTLSRQVKRLETYLGYPLFIRKQGHPVVELTSKGEKFHRIALEIYQLCKDAKSLNKEEERKQLRVSIVQSVLSCIMPNIAQDFSIYHPGICLSLHTHYSDTAYTLLKNDELDAAIVGKFYSLHDIHVMPLFLESWRFVCAKDESYPEEIYPGNLDPCKQISMWNFLSNAWFKKWFSDTSPSPLNWHTLSLMMQKDSFQDGKWAVVPASVARYIESAGFCNVHTLTDPPPARIIYIAHRRDADPVAMEAFKQCIYMGLKDIPEITTTL